jgi:hypothetical protein
VNEGLYSDDRWFSHAMGLFCSSSNLTVVIPGNPGYHLKAV